MKIARGTTNCLTQRRKEGRKDSKKAGTLRLYDVFAPLREILIGFGDC